MTCDEARARLSWVLDGEAPEIEPHLAECAACRAELERLRKADALLAQAAERFAPPVQSRAARIASRFRRRRVWKWVWSAAALLLAAFLGSWIWVNVRTPDPQEVFVFGGSGGVFRVVVLDGRTQKPVEGARVRARLGSSTTEAVSDGSGSASVRLDPPEGSSAVVEISVDSSAGSDSIRHELTIERPVRVLLSTDKPLYQPSQTIHLRALALSNLTMKPYEGEVTIEVEDANGNRVFKKELRSSAYGIASVDFDLADEVNFGTWRIRATAGKATSERTVEVKRYLLPKFKIEIAPDSPFYAPAQKLVATLDARYTFGEPVADAAVQVELSSWVGGKFEPFGQVTTKTDAAGKGWFETKLPDRFFGTELASGDATMRIEATVTDGASHKETKAVALTVTSRPIRVQVFPESGEYVKGVPGGMMYVVASYPDGRPAQASVKLSDRSASLETDETGVLQVAIHETSFNVEVRDPKGRWTQMNVNLADHPAAQDFILRPDRTTYRAGQTMDLSVLSARDGVVYIDLVKGGQTLLTKWIEVRQGRGRLAVDLPAELFGTVRVTGYRIRSDGQIARDSRPIVVDLPGDLQIRPTVRKESFKPGEEIEVSFEVLGPDGKPVPAAIGLAVVDEAVFALHESRPGLEKVYFQIEEDLLKPRHQLKGLESLALSVASPVRMAGASAPDVPLAAVVLASSKAISLQQRTEEFNEAAQTILFCLFVLGIIGGIVRGFVWAFRQSWSMVLGLSVACGLVLIIVTTFATLGAIREDSPEASGPAASEAGVHEPPRPSKAIPVPKAEPLSEGVGAPRIRQFFPETLYWNPQLITDDRGRASLRFPGADSITTWRMAMSAVTKGGKLGSGEAGIRVFQPFFVDLDLPVALTQGDEVWLPVAVYNYLKEPQTIAFSLEAESGLEVVGERAKKIDVRPDQVTSVRFHVRAARFGRFALTVKAIGTTHSDAVRRTIDVFPDGKEIPVTESNRLSGKSTSTIRIPAEAIDGASRLWVRLFPSTFSEIVTGLEGLVRMPYG